MLFQRFLFCLSMARCDCISDYNVCLFLLYESGSLFDFFLFVLRFFFHLVFHFLFYSLLQLHCFTISIFLSPTLTFPPLSFLFHCLHQDCSFKISLHLLPTLLIHWYIFYMAFAFNPFQFSEFSSSYSETILHLMLMADRA